MQLNPAVSTILKEFNIDVDKGLLCLLGIYHKLDFQAICGEEVVKAINLTKIVDIDYVGKTGIKWNMPLYEGQETDFAWVITDWNTKWNKNQSRKGANSDCIKRMKEFFAKYPHIRKDDVMKATDLYFKQNQDPQYWKNSAAFIFDGAGAMKKSILLGWVEKLPNFGSNTSDQMRGRVIQ